MPEFATWIQHHLWNLAYKLLFPGLGLPLLTFWRKMLKGALLLSLAINTTNILLRTNLFFSIKLEKNTKFQPVPEELSPFISILLIINSVHKGALNCACGSQMLPQWRVNSGNTSRIPLGGLHPGNPCSEHPNNQRRCSQKSSCAPQSPER